MGRREGRSVGEYDGFLLGIVVGMSDGFKVGVELGIACGTNDGKALGEGLGCVEEVGIKDTVGTGLVGVNDGCFVGEGLGRWVGRKVGCPVIFVDGCVGFEMIGAGEEGGVSIVGTPGE